MKNTRSIGIRLPTELWDYVKACEPDLTYSEIVKSALEELYLDEEEDVLVVKSAAIPAETKPSPKYKVQNIYNIIDSWGMYQ